MVTFVPLDFIGTMVVMVTLMSSLPHSFDITGTIHKGRPHTHKGQIITITQNRPDAGSLALSVPSIHVQLNFSDVAAEQCVCRREGKRTGTSHCRCSGLEGGGALETHTYCKRMVFPHIFITFT
jgi:hypothetical protein